MVEHFQVDQIGFIPMQEKQGVAYAFLNIVGHFGAPTEVLIDHDTKFYVSLKTCAISP